MTEKGGAYFVFAERGAWNRLGSYAVRLGLLIIFAGLALLLITGAVWVNESWGRYWGWGSKETGAFVARLTYGAFLHVRISRGWTGRDLLRHRRLPLYSLHLPRRQLSFAGSSLLRVSGPGPELRVKESGLFNAKLGARNGRES